MSAMFVSQKVRKSDGGQVEVKGQQISALGSMDRKGKLTPRQPPDVITVKCRGPYVPDLLVGLKVIVLTEIQDKRMGNPSFIGDMQAHDDRHEIAHDYAMLADMNISYPRIVASNGTPVSERQIDAFYRLDFEHYKREQLLLGLPDGPDGLKHAHSEYLRRRDECVRYMTMIGMLLRSSQQIRLNQRATLINLSGAHHYLEWSQKAALIASLQPNHVQVDKEEDELYSVPSHPRSRL